jgi:hypothetical protein
VALAGCAYDRRMTDDDAPYSKPPWLEALNELTEGLEGIEMALDKPERFTSEALAQLAREIEEAARRHNVFEPLD